MLALVAIEFLTHAVLRYQDAAAREAVLTGPGRQYFLVVALTFLIGVVLFGIASWRAGALPRAALALYVPGLSAAALRAAVPEVLYLGGLTAGAAGVLWFSVVLLRDATRPALVTA